MFLEGEAGALRALGEAIGGSAWLAPLAVQATIALAALTALALAFAVLARAAGRADREAGRAEPVA